MSKQIKTAVFSVNYWEDVEPPEYSCWRKCVDKNINYDYIFTCPGNYCDPKIMENKIEVVQIDIKKTKEYNRDWSYFRVGFLNALYHLMLNIKDFDIAIHVQNNTIINMDLNPIINEFYEREEIIAAPQFLSEGGLMIETALMLLKKEAILKYITSPLRPSLTENETLNVEEEAIRMFFEDWWNFLPNTTSIRKNDFIIFEDLKSPFKLSNDTFLNLPIVFMSSSYVFDDDINEWKKYNNI